jgi:hypothetical protein
LAQRSTVGAQKPARPFAFFASSRWQLQLQLFWRCAAAAEVGCRRFSAWLETAANHADISDGYDMP